MHSRIIRICQTCAAQNSNDILPHHTGGRMANVIGIPKDLTYRRLPSICFVINSYARIESSLRVVWGCFRSLEHCGEKQKIGYRPAYCFYTTINSTKGPFWARGTTTTASVKHSFPMKAFPLDTLLCCVEVLRMSLSFSIRMLNHIKAFIVSLIS